MKKIPLTQIIFDQPISGRHMRKFRGAVIGSVMQLAPKFAESGLSPDLFHNHKGPAPTEGESRRSKGADRLYHYPKIQYQLRHGKAAIMGIGEGAHALQLWLSWVGDEFMVNDRPFSLAIADHRQVFWQPALGDKCTTYRINKWIAFNAANHDEWKQTPRLLDKARLLDKRLWGHICHLFEGLDITMEKENLELFVSTIDHQTYADCYGVQKLALDITFRTNLNLPAELGLGQGTTAGYGKTQPISTRPRVSRRTISFRKDAVE